MSHTHPIPKGIIYLAITSLVAMSERETFKVRNLTNTCKQIAAVTCKKLDITDRRMMRCLTNRLVSYAHENVGL